jgi:hypothetical protein
VGIGFRPGCSGAVEMDSVSKIVSGLTPAGREEGDAKYFTERIPGPLGIGFRPGCFGAVEADSVS